MRRRVAIAASAAAVLVGIGLFVLLDGPGAGRASPSADDAVPAASAVPADDAPEAPVVPVPRRCVAGTVQPTGSSTVAVAALVARPTVARRAPGGAAITRLGLRNVNGVRTVLAVRGVRLGADCRASWYRVQLPVRPNGATGWVPARDVRRFVVDTRVVVDLSERLVTVYRRGERVLRVRAAVGKAATPTPTGHFYVNQRLLADDPTGPWGPGGVGVSAFSPVLVDWAQGGPIAIHGTNQPYLIGDAVSNGCVRVSNYHLRQLMDIAVEGTPVLIRA